MNFSQRFGLFILIVISIAYVYFSFFNKDYELPNLNNRNNESSNFEPLEPIKQSKSPDKNELKETDVKIFLIDTAGNLRSLRRTCNPNIENSCFEYSIRELVSAPTKWEKSKGFTSEIPVGTKVLSVRESANSIMIDLSSNFESGGGAESTYMRIKQIIKTANANTKIPTYLYINGRQANVIGGEGIMIKQPLNERSFDE